MRVEKAFEQHRLSREEIQELLLNAEVQDELFQAADRTRTSFVGSGIHVRGLLEFSNICRQKCFYCGLRKENARVDRYRLSSSEILSLVQRAKNYGYQTIVLQSGEDLFFSVEVLVPLIREIKQMDLAVTLSIGERGYEEYRAFRKAGADRYLLRIETTDVSLYQRLHPGMSWRNRVSCLENLRKLGYEVGTGCMVGLPGQTLKSLADDLLFFQEMDADMVGIGPFIPHDATPLRGTCGGDLALTRRMVALCRLLLPEANIPTTTAVEVTSHGSRDEFLRSGCNVFMLNIAGYDCSRKYEIYAGREAVNDRLLEPIENLNRELVKMNRYVAKNKGSRQRGFGKQGSMNYYNAGIPSMGASTILP